MLHTEKHNPFMIRMNGQQFKKEKKTETGLRKECIRFPTNKHFFFFTFSVDQIAKTKFLLNSEINIRFNELVQSMK